MKLESRLSWRHGIACIVLCTACYYGDELLRLNSPRGLLLRAVTDNATHGTLAVLTWLLGYLCHKSRDRLNNRFSNHSNLMLSHTKVIIQSMVCGMISCLVDVDHFIAAGSFDLEAATHSSSRGLLHNSFIPVIMAVYYYTHRRSLAVVVLVAMVTHQLRDGVRRGLYFFPLASTPPLPYPLYLVAMCLVMMVFPSVLPKRERIIYMVPQVA